MGLRCVSIVLLACVLGTARIDHVVVIVQENRSVDNLFHGFPGADTAAYGYGHGKKYVLRPWSLANPLDINHSRLQFLEDYDSGRNDGFDRVISGFARSCGDPYNQPACWQFYGPPYVGAAYSYVPRGQVVPYWMLAEQYAFADRAFASNNGPSYPSHEYAIAGESGHVVENPLSSPWGCDAPPSDRTVRLRYGSTKPPVFSARTGLEIPGPYPCFTYRTIADLLDGRRVSWAYYAPALGGDNGDIWSPFDAVWQVRFGPDWFVDVKSPETRIFNDIAAGTLASVTWVSPSFVNSDHAGSSSLTGPDWVASVVNAVGESRYWNTTAIVILWDEWGGWYDHVVPPQYPDPHTGAYEGLGFRVPLIVVSPYARSHYVSHRQHEIASSLHFIEKVFQLPSLGGADARADALDDMFDFSQAPRQFTPIPTHLHATDFVRQPRSAIPPDD